MKIIDLLLFFLGGLIIGFLGKKKKVKLPDVIPFKKVKLKKKSGNYLNQEDFLKRLKISSGTKQEKIKTLCALYEHIHGKKIQFKTMQSRIAKWGLNRDYKKAIETEVNRK